MSATEKNSPRQKARQRRRPPPKLVAQPGNASSAHQVATSVAPPVDSSAEAAAARESHAVKPARRTDRRRLRRKLVRLPAVVYADGKAVQVVMRDQSDASLGFISPVGFAPGQQVYLKIGIGPGRLPVGVLVARCDREGEAFDIGGKIVGPEITDKP